MTDIEARRRNLERELEWARRHDCQVKWAVVKALERIKNKEGA